MAYSIQTALGRWVDVGDRESVLTDQVMRVLFDVARLAGALVGMDEERLAMVTGLDGDEWKKFRRSLVHRHLVVIKKPHRVMLTSAGHQYVMAAGAAG